MSTEKTFKLRIDIEGDQQLADMLVATCFYMSFTQSTSNDLSKAVFSFRFKAKYDGTYIPDYLPKALTQVEKITFQIVSLQDEAQIQQQHHVIGQYNIKIENRGMSYVLDLSTVEEKKAKMRLEDKSRAHRYSTLSDMATQILTENEFEVEGVQPTKAIPEFEVLRQPYVSDFNFLTDYISPRAVSESGQGGYRLFTSDGVKAHWASLGFEASDKTIEDEMLISVEPARQMQWVAEAGSMKHQSGGFDMNRKRPLQSKLVGPEVTPSYGSVDIPKDYAEAPAYSMSPYTTQPAVDSLATRHQYAERYSAFPLILKVRGSAGWDEVPYNVETKRLHDQGGGSVRGYASQVVHTYAGGSYNITIFCLRDRVDTV